MDKSKVYLVQTDTTVGFSSNDDEKLSLIKQRPINQKILQTVDTLSTLKQQTRIPKKFKKQIRRAKQTTFIYPNGNSFRVIDSNCEYYQFLKKVQSIYSTSANLTKHTFDYGFAKMHADILVETKDGFAELSSSSIYKLNKSQIKRIR